MAKYAVAGGRTSSASTTVLGLSAPGSSMRRLKVMDLTLGSEATPADNAHRFQLKRSTAAGTSTSVTPKPLDFADAACAAVAGQNHTVEPTYTAGEIMLDIPLNQRASFRWVAQPGEEIIIPATANAGVGLFTSVATAGVLVTSTIIFDE